MRTKSSIKLQCWCGVQSIATTAPGGAHHTEIGFVTDLLFISKFLVPGGLSTYTLNVWLQRIPIYCISFSPSVLLFFSCIIVLSMMMYLFPLPRFWSRLTQSTQTKASGKWKCIFNPFLYQKTISCIIKIWYVMFQCEAINVRTYSSDFSQSIEFYWSPSVDLCIQ